MAWRYRLQRVQEGPLLTGGGIGKIFTTHKGRIRKSFVYLLVLAGELAGMMLGGVSRGKQVVSIHYLDTPPNKTDLSTSISTIAITFSATLGSILNSKFIAVYEPNAPLEKRLVDDFDFSYENPFGVTDAMYRSLT